MERPLDVADPLLVVLIGPTGSGKTALSMALATEFSAEIINCDSVAMYREFEIGTAKPTRDQREQVRHHLLDFVEPTSYVTAGSYAQQARALLAELKNRGVLPLVVGGTGLYLRALLDGLFPGPQRSEEVRARLRDVLESRGPGHLHGILRKLDPAAACKIHQNDTPKVLRAIEVCLAARKPMTELWKQGQEPLLGFRIFRIGLNPERGALYERINQRARRMFEDGLVEETQSLLAKFGEKASPLQSLGYRQALQFLKGELDIQQATNAAQQAHRNYAKRQMTWFRREPDVHWLQGFGDDPKIKDESFRLIKQMMQFNA
jgi:tRNA dimethylallyltransferase